jgi:hypothetical protein
MRALRRLREARKPILAPEPEKLVLSPGQKLMHVGLVPDVEEDAVAAAVENPVDRERDLHDAEVGGQMSPGP